MPSGLHTWSQTSGSNATADSAINWAEGQAPSSVNDSARAAMAVIAKWRDDNNGSLTTGGTSTAYILATNTVFTSLALMDNQTLKFTMHATSGASPTLNVDGLGAKPIHSATTVSPGTGALVAASVYSATYDNSVGEWLLHDQLALVLGANTVTTTSITDANVTYAKIQNVAASRLLGNPTGSPAAPSEISLGAGLSFSGTSVISTLDPTVVPGYLSGLTLSTAGSSATFGIAAGGANDTASGGMMVLASAYTKTTSAWAVGSGNGALDTSTISPSTWYHVFLIKRTDTGVVDVLFSLSPTSPTLPTNYTLSRRIGSMKTNGSSQWTSFTQTADTFIWAAPVTDVSTAATGSRVNTALTVPSGVVVAALFRAGMNTGAGSLATIFTSLQENDTAPTTGGVNDLAQAASAYAGGSFERLTDTSRQIGVRSTSTNATITISTYGWKDSRGK